MGKNRPSRGEVLKGLLFEGAERRDMLIRWLKSPRHRPWMRPEDMTDQLTAPALFQSKL